ncbi:MAG: Gfo/Idh/MocA family oxidoreductase [Verrucomicrobiota bacterium]
MKKLSRRDYLKSSALVGGTIFLPRFSIGKPGGSANGKLNIALIGAGGIARTAFGDCRKENVIAIAEVDEVRGEPGLTEFAGAKVYKDFRRLLDAHYKELDLVIVSTPDHTHFAMTYAAMERGIAVHTQKPLTHNLWQARTLAAAAEKFKVQTVMGNQGHNFEGMRLVREWYEAGLIGEVREVHAWTNRTTQNNSNAKKRFPEQPIPSTLDWDLWQGPNPEAPYNKAYVPSGWRWHWQYGAGGLGDIGCHTLEVPYYAMQLGYPTAVSLVDLDFRHEFDGGKTKKDAATYLYEFPARGSKPAVKVYWYEGGRMPRFPEIVDNGVSKKLNAEVEGGCLLIGDKNTLYAPGMRPTSPRLVKDWLELRRNLPPKTVPRAVGNPVKEIITAIRGDIPQCGSNFAYAGPLTEVVLLGTLANRFQTRVEYNPAEMTFSNAELNEYVKGPVRSGWEYGEGLI